MDFKEWLISEMPIEKMDFHGDWSPTAKRNYGFKNRDARLLSSEKAQTKICRMWRNTAEKINLCFVRTPQSYNTRQRFRSGEVDSEWVKTNLGIDITPDEDTIHMIYAGNDDQTMTGWILAHRMAHAFLGTNEFAAFNYELMKALQDTLDKVYRHKTRLTAIGDDPNTLNTMPEHEKVYTALARALGTMRSAREKKLLSTREFTYELIAQYLINGKEMPNNLMRNYSIQFNNLPQALKWRSGYNHMSRGADREEHEDADYQFQEVLPGILEYYIGEMFNSFKGRIFFMM